VVAQESEQLPLLLEPFRRNSSCFVTLTLGRHRSIATSVASTSSRGAQKITAEWSLSNPPRVSAGNHGACNLIPALGFRAEESVPNLNPLELQSRTGSDRLDETTANAARSA
jgi:hypothetical protein